MVAALPGPTSARDAEVVLPTRLGLRNAALRCVLTARRLRSARAASCGCAGPTSTPVTAIGKVYKAALRVRATRRVLDERLAQLGLADRVRLQVDEAPSGLVLCFDLADAALEGRVRELIRPFALTYRTRVG